MAVFGSTVLRLLRGTIVGQGLLYLSMPILARIYGPADFGIAQAALSLMSLLLIAGALRLEIAVLSTSEIALADLFRCAWWICIVVCGAAWVVTLIISALSTSWSPTQRLILILIPPISVLACWNQLISYLALRRQAFKPSAMAKVVQPVGYAAGAFLLGSAWPSSPSLLMADAAGRVSATMVLSRAMHLTRRDVSRPSLSVLRKVMFEHRELVTVGLVAAMVNAAGSAFTAALLLGLFGAFEAGQYAMVERLVGMPVGLLAATVSQVFVANLSESIARQDARSTQAAFTKVLRFQTATGLPVAAVLFVLAPWLLTLMLGPGWEAAGAFARALIPLYLCAYIVAPLNMTLTVMGRQRMQLVWDFLRLILTGGAWIFIWWRGLESTSALQAYAAASCIAYASYVVLTKKALQAWSDRTMKES